MSKNLSNLSPDSQKPFSFDVKPIDKTIIYIEKHENYCRRHKLDFDNPTVNQAAKRLGIIYENCVLKSLDEFKEENQELRMHRYRIHQKRVKDSIAQLYEEVKCINKEGMKKGQLYSIEDIKQNSIEFKKSQSDSLLCDPNQLETLSRIKGKVENDSKKFENSLRKNNVDLRQYAERKNYSTIYTINDKMKEKNTEITSKMKQEELQEKIGKNQKHREEVRENFKKMEHQKFTTSLARFNEIHKKAKLEVRNEAEALAKFRTENYNDQKQLKIQDQKVQEEKQKNYISDLQGIRNSLSLFENKLKKINEDKNNFLKEKSSMITQSMKKIDENKLKSINKMKEVEEKKLEEFMQTIFKIKEAKMKRLKEIKKKFVFLNKEKSKLQNAKKNKEMLKKRDNRKLANINSINNYDIINTSNNYEFPQKSQHEKDKDKDKSDLKNQDSLDNSRNSRNSRSLSSKSKNKKKQIKFIICQEAQQYNFERLKRLRDQKKLQVMEKFTRLQQKLDEKKKEEDFYFSLKLKDQFETEYKKKEDTEKTLKKLRSKNFSEKDLANIVKDKGMMNTIKQKKTSIISKDSKDSKEQKLDRNLDLKDAKNSLWLTSLK